MDTICCRTGNFLSGRKVLSLEYIRECAAIVAGISTTPINHDVRA